MAKIFTDQLLVAIDVGTTKICVIVAQPLGDDRVEILALGKAPCQGLRKGVVVDVAKTIQSIKAAVKEAELMAGIDIESASIGISGGHIQSLNSHGVVPLRRAEIRQSDIDNVIAAAKAIPIPEGQQILHALPQYFVVDTHNKVQDPLGMHGIRLEVMTHIILGAIASVQNLVKCCQMAGITVSDIVLEQLASARAVLSPDELELGVAVLDIGGGTSDLAVYQQGNIRHTFVLPIAGNHFTQDIAIGLRTTLQEAERIKHDYAVACVDLLTKDEIFEVELVQGVGKQIVCASDLSYIVHSRAQELLQLINQEIVEHKLMRSMPTGLVITGGGSLLRGMKELAERVFSMPVRIGTVRVEYDIPELLTNPIYATCYGLIMHALAQSKRMGNTFDSARSHTVVARMKSWVLDFF